MVKSLKIFIGYDSREKVAFHVLSHSILANSSIPVSITPINLKKLINIDATSIMMINNID